MESKVFRPVIRSPPITTGYGRPNSAFTFSRAASMAERFSGLLKSVSGSFLKSGNDILRSPCCSGDGMYFKRLLIATCSLLLCASCAGMLPWRNAPAAHEVNLAFTLEMNLLYITSATVDGRPGRFLLGSAEPRSVLDSAFVRSVG